MVMFSRRFGIFSAAAFFLAGLVAGGWRSDTLSAQSCPGGPGRPKSVIHVVVYKWKEGVSAAEKEAVLSEIPKLARQIRGMKNVWLKTQRNQMRDFDGVYAIEFASPEAAADYAESPAHDAWAKKWQDLRQTSLSFQVTNP